MVSIGHARYYSGSVASRSGAEKGSAIHSIHAPVPSSPNPGDKTAATRTRPRPGPQTRVPALLRVTNRPLNSALRRPPGVQLEFGEQIVATDHAVRVHHGPRAQFLRVGPRVEIPLLGRVAVVGRRARHIRKIPATRSPFRANHLHRNVDWLLRIAHPRRRAARENARGARDEQSPPAPRNRSPSRG